jgi:hypothetical protein
MIDTYRAEHEGQQISVRQRGRPINKSSRSGACSHGSLERCNIPATSRIELVKEIIDEAEGSVLVCSFLTWHRSSIHGVLRRVRAGCRASLRDTPRRASANELFRDSQMANRPLRILVANLALLSHGLTLTQANTIIGSADPPNEIYRINGRIVRRQRATVGGQHRRSRPNASV